MMSKYARNVHVYAHFTTWMLDHPLQGFTDPVAAEFNQTTVEISCEICANPFPAEDAFTWMVNDTVNLSQVLANNSINALVHINCQ